MSETTTMTLTSEQLDALDKALRSVQVEIDGADAVVRGTDDVLCGLQGGRQPATLSALLDLRQNMKLSRAGLATAWRHIAEVRNIIEKHRRRSGEPS